MIQFNANSLTRAAGSVRRACSPLPRKFRDGNSFQKALTASLSANLPKSGINRPYARFLGHCWRSHSSNAVVKLQHLPWLRSTHPPRLHNAAGALQAIPRNRSTTPIGQHNHLRFKRCATWTTTINAANWPRNSVPRVITSTFQLWYTAGTRPRSPPRGKVTDIHGCLPPCRIPLRKRLESPRPAASLTIPTIRPPAQSRSDRTGVTEPRP